MRTVGAIKIDLVRDEVTVDGQARRAHAVGVQDPRLLAGAPGAAYTRRQIMEHLWGSTFTADEHTCEVHVSALRRKIERDPTSPERLVTVRGVGYAQGRLEGRLSRSVPGGGPPRGGPGPGLSSAPVAVPAHVAAAQLARESAVAE